MSEQVEEKQPAEFLTVEPHVLDALVELKKRREKGHTPGCLCGNSIVPSCRELRQIIIDAGLLKELLND